MAIVLLVTGFTLLGEGINDVLNPLIRERALEPPTIPVERETELPPAGAAPATGAAETQATEVRRE